MLYDFNLDVGLTVIWGGMFSGKTYLLNMIARRLLKRGDNVFLYRFTHKVPREEAISTPHDCVEDLGIEEVSPDHLNDLDISKFAKDPIFIVDEAQFMDMNSINTILNAIHHGVRFVVIGLDMDFQGNPWLVMALLAAYADEVIKLHAICEHCAGNAGYSYRLEGGENIVQEGSEDYIALCRNCYSKMVERFGYVKEPNEESYCDLLASELDARDAKKHSNFLWTPHPKIFIAKEDTRPESMAHEFGQLIILSGPIGVGKSTLGKALVEGGHATYYPEIIDAEQLDNFYLVLKQLQSGEVKESAIPLSFQFYMMARRFMIYQTAMRNCWAHGGLHVVDRSIWEDSIFESSLYNQGYINKCGHDAYNMHLSTMSKILLVPHKVLYLYAPPDVLLPRIRERGRKFECDITYDYLQSWEKSAEPYLENMAKMGSKVLRFDWSEFGSVEEILEQVKEIL